jgi:seryl-tRNA synthetase
VPNEVRLDSPQQEQFLRELIDAGHLIETGVPGVYGHGEAFERIRLQLGALISAQARAGGAAGLTFPPIIPKLNLETTGYVGNFPHLAGSIFGFEGSEAEARQQRERATEHGDWSEFQTQTDLMMLPAACYPVYPAIAARGDVKPGGVFIDMGGTWVFRHEPSLDPARRQAFRQHELVRIGEAETVIAWREEWSRRGVELLRGLGLEAELEVASDPFFGRHGRLLAANQSAEELKWELAVPIAGPEPTACASFNYHLDRFGQTWGLRMQDGTTAHTGCVGFGQERIVVALLHRHGLDPARWSAQVHERLGGHSAEHERLGGASAEAAQATEAAAASELPPC